MSASNTGSPAESARASITLPQKKGGVWGKLDAKMKENPMVFVFSGLTVAALAGGLVSLAKNNKQRSQTMMRLRVLFQLSAVSTLIGSMYLKMNKSGAVQQRETIDSEPLPALVNENELLGLSSDSSPAGSAELK